MAGAAVAASFEQRRRPPAAGHAAQRPPVRRTAVVFIGGYFYDPYFGPYPWWPRAAYPYPYYPAYYDNRATIRVLATPQDAAVYVDGYYAGIVDDFNSWFQGLPVPPGGHEVVLYRDGYRTIRRRVYVGPGSTIKLHETLQPLPPGDVSERPTARPQPPPPPEGTYLPPRTPPAVPLPPAGGAPPETALGMLALRVQPATADVRVDGERWVSSDSGRFSIQLPGGAHRVEVTAPGFRPYANDVEIADGQTVTLNVSLVRDR
jgi:hypothetical protein